MHLKIQKWTPLKRPIKLALIHPSKIFVSPANAYKFTLDIQNCPTIEKKPFSLPSSLLCCVLLDSYHDGPSSSSFWHTSQVISCLVQKALQRPGIKTDFRILVLSSRPVVEEKALKKKDHQLVSNLSL